MILSNKNFFSSVKKKKRILNNLLSGFSSEGIQIITQIFFAPLMILFWGLENFGIWVFLLSIPNIFIIFNISTFDASIQEMTMFKANGNIKKANEIFQNSIVLVFLNMIIFTILIIVFYLFFSFDLSILQNINSQEIPIIFILLILSIYINLAEGILLTGINSEGKLYIGFNISGVIEFLSKIFIALSGFIFVSLLYPVIIFFLFTVIKFLLNFYFFKLHTKKLVISLKLVSKKILKKILKLSIGHNADIVTNIARHSVVIIILGIFYGPLMVGFVATIKTMFYFMPIRFFGKFNHILLYEYANLFAKKKFNQIIINLKSVIKIIFSLLFLFIISSIIIGPFVYKLWLNNKYEIDLLFLVIIVFDVFFFILRDTIVSALKAVNKYALLGLSELIIIITSVFLFYLSLYFDYSYQFSFSILLFGSIISLFFSSIILYFFLMKIYKKK